MWRIRSAREGDTSMYLVSWLVRSFAAQVFVDQDLFESVRTDDEYDIPLNPRYGRFKLKLYLGGGLFFSGGNPAVAMGFLKQSIRRVQRLYVR